MRGVARWVAGPVAAIAAWGLGAAGARAGEKLDGFWMDSDGEVILEVGSCGDARCAKVAWLRQPLGPDGKALTDYRNSDPVLRSRPVCGLDVVTGFKKQPDGTWGNGTVYVPDIGSSFSGYAEVLSPTQVKVTGYVFLPLFGSSETWTRVSSPFPHCQTDAARLTAKQDAAKPASLRISPAAPEKKPAAPMAAR